MQITLYIPKELEGKLLGLAEANGQSVQQVLLSPWRGKVSVGQLDRIESKVDLLSEWVVSLTTRRMTESEVRHQVEPLIDETVTEIRDYSSGGKDEQVTDGLTVMDIPGVRKVVLSKSAEEFMKKQIETDEDIRKANERLMKKRVEVKGAIKTVKDVPQWAGGYSKERQLGKKVKK